MLSILSAKKFSVPDFTYEQAARDAGHQIICGIDEAGRGPLAGPVVAAAVILPQDFVCLELNDSKKLSAKKREKLLDELISNKNVFWAYAVIEAEVIDRINILRATHLAMRTAVENLQSKYTLLVEHCLIDGLPVPHFPFSSRGIVKGDGLSLSIAAASIIAKQTRDALMHEYAKKYPQYGFEKHMGYGTKAHLAALENHGATPLHRRSFQPVAQLTFSLSSS